MTGGEDPGLLSEAERERAAAFQRAEDRRHWVAVRSALRQVLGRQLGLDPAGLVFEAGPNDKPEVAGRPLRFSLAHSGGLALVAVTERADVGADLERLAAAPARPPSAERFFSEAERGRLAALSGRRRLELFYALWTEKEAYRKATGEGITAGLGELDWRGWTRLRPEVPAGYAAAIAVRAPGAVLTPAAWPP
jgi:4'-phosphopantetheinyl transferase